MSTSLTSWAALAGAILCEVTGTAFLNKSEHITRLAPTLASAAFYAVSFYLLAQALRGLPLGVAYAVWGGVGIVLTTIIGVVVFKQQLNGTVILGIGFIVVGVVIVNMFSKAGSP